MDASQFDAWTRRRFGFVVGGGVVALADLHARDVANAKKRRKRNKKKRCLKLAVSCGGKKPCCKGLTCSPLSLSPDSSVCCKPPRATCEDQAACCGGAICSTIDGLEGERCCVGVAQPCAADEDCCGNLFCNLGDTNTCVSDQP